MLLNLNQSEPFRPIEINFLFNYLTIYTVVAYRIRFMLSQQMSELFFYNKKEKEKRISLEIACVDCRDPQGKVVGANAHPPPPSSTIQLVPQTKRNQVGIWNLNKFQ